MHRLGGGTFGCLKRVWACGFVLVKWDFLKENQRLLSVGNIDGTIILSELIWYYGGFVKGERRLFYWWWHRHLLGCTYEVFLYKPSSSHTLYILSFAISVYIYHDTLWIIIYILIRIITGPSNLLRKGRGWWTTPRIINLVITHVRSTHEGTGWYINQGIART